MTRDDATLKASSICESLERLMMALIRRNGDLPTIRSVDDAESELHSSRIEVKNVLMSILENIDS